MSPMSIILFSIALLLLIVTSEYFVRVFIQLCKQLRVSTLIISAAISAVGTSIPELFTSLQAIINHDSHLVMGNIIGSNVINITLCLGVGALPSVIHVEQPNIIRKLTQFFLVIIVLSIIFMWSSMVMAGLLEYLIYIIFMAGLMIYHLFFASEKQETVILYIYAAIIVLHILFYNMPFNIPMIPISIPTTDVFYPMYSFPGFLMMIFIPVWTVVLYKLHRSHIHHLPLPESPSVSFNRFKIWIYIFLVVIMFPLLMFISSHIAILETMNIVEYFGLDSKSFGAIVMALGTNAPEILSILAASRLKHHDIILGNIIGSNIFNSFIFAMAFISGYGTLNSKIMLDLDMMMLYSVIFVILITRTNVIGRKIAALAFLGYIIFTTIQLLSLT